MVSPQVKTKRALTFFGLILIVAAAYYAYTALAPADLFSLGTAKTVVTDMPISVITSPEYQNLRSFANLPVVPTNVGRPNPFLPLPNVNLNTPANIKR